MELELDRIDSERRIGSCPEKERHSPKKGKVFFFLFLSFENVKKERGFLAWSSMRKDWRLERRKKLSGGLPQLFFRFVGLILKNLKFVLFFFLTPFLLSLPGSVKGPFKRAQKAFQSREGRGGRERKASS